jgi:hypothetical protein
VDSGTIAFMGDYTVNQDTDLTHPDDVQMCFMPLVDPNALLKLGGTKEAVMAAVASGLAGGFSYSGVLGEVVQDKRTEETFLEKALDDLHAGGWSGVVQRRIEAVRLKQ